MEKVLGTRTRTEIKDTLVLESELEQTSKVLELELELKPKILGY